MCSDLYELFTFGMTEYDIEECEVDPDLVGKTIVTEWIGLGKADRIKVNDRVRAGYSYGEIYKELSKEIC